ncbi:peroxiredoxin [Halodurantibacterium flavum]|uniref:Alkyl hydroperoxide reductase C n=1 Tax=Halodurantibacterium flavum TaxID=1382802 RepID=A0ABW4S3C7_9RHOB
MPLLLGDIVPDFTADTTTGPVSFHDWIGDDWAFFFSHPADFTPVCTTEMGRTSQLSAEFDKRGVKPIGLSTDSVDEHLKWIDDVNDTQNTTLRFPIVADPDLQIARLYDMIHPAQSETAAVRSVFIIDNNKKLRLTMTYPMSVGRNFDEILRAVDALQAGDRHRIATPADWRPGDEVIIPPSIDDAAAKGLFPQGWTTHRPYLRTTRVQD